MDKSVKVPERQRRDWLIVILTLLVGFGCILVAADWALRFAPSWSLNANMESQLDPNSDFLTRRSGSLIEPLDSAILTQPVWIDVFLTPGAIVPTRLVPPTQPATLPVPPSATATRHPAATRTVAVVASPTSGIIHYPPPATATPTRRHRATATPNSVPTLTQTPVITPTMTFTPTDTPVGSPTAVATDPTPPEIGTTPDGITYNLQAGDTLTLGLNITVNGHAGWDLVYYELPAGSGILLDWVIIEIGDGNNWYTIFNWGDNNPDLNTNVGLYIQSNPQDPQEPDQRDIPSAELYNSTGVAIDLDSVVPPGNYSYIRFYAPTGDVDGQLEIDAIQILP